MKLRDLATRWCLRMTVYRPEKWHSATHVSVGVEGPIDQRLGEFLQVLSVHLNRLDRDDFQALDRISTKLKTHDGKAQQ